MTQKQLQDEIVARSESASWEDAQPEWELDYIYRIEDGEPERCLCGHFPIIELCVLFNTENGNRATVGNCCVKRFMGLQSDLIFQGIKRISDDDEKAINEAAIEYSYAQGWLNDWEYKFALSTRRKRVLTGKQAASRERINAKVLKKFGEASAIAQFAAVRKRLKEEK